MTKTLHLKEFLESSGIVIDVRSPSEYRQGQIPGALNLPLFTDDERAEVGITYKHRGSSQAISLGMKIVAPKIPAFISDAKAMLQGERAKIHCWRGGMRSASLAMLFQQTGTPSTILTGGYKTFRRWTLEVFERPYRYAVLGGMTGTGKTEILSALKKVGEQVIDLEGLANHRGSVFGNIGLPQQPTTEQFHNDLAVELEALDPGRPVWIENESRQIGSCHLPEALFDNLTKASLFVIERPLKERMDILLKEYGNAPEKELIEATRRITKKLGGEKTETVVTYLREKNPRAALEVLLPYYDATYQYGIVQRPSPLHTVSADNLHSDAWAQKLTSLIHAIRGP